MHITLIVIDLLPALAQSTPVAYDRDVAPMISAAGYEDLAGRELLLCMYLRNRGQRFRSKDQKVEKPLRPLLAKRKTRCSARSRVGSWHVSRDRCRQLYSSKMPSVHTPVCRWNNDGLESTVDGFGKG